MTRTPDYWNSVYENEPRPGWDMNGPTPLVAELLDLGTAFGLQAGCSIAVPGCGYGHDAAELAGLGYRVTGLDFAPLALQGARARYGDRVDWHECDWFTTQLGPWKAVFDHTCFVAMDPDRRTAYAEVCAAHLEPGGLWMAALFHEVNQQPGPPHAITPEAMRVLVSDRFEVLHLAEAERSHPRRAGREFLMVARRR